MASNGKGTNDTTPPKTVLVTGINGFIAAKLGLTLLEKGYTLRGTARKTSSTTALLAGPYAPYASRVEIIEVPDMTIPNAFNDAVKGVHGIFHTASPVDFTVTDPDNFTKPALAGTEAIINAASNHAGPQLEALVVTSSIFAVAGPIDPEHVYTEADWWDEALEITLRDGKKAGTQYWYPASKILAEKALWRFHEQKKPSFSISAILPAVVTGPPALLVDHPSKLNNTLQPTWELLSGAVKNIDDANLLGYSSYVDLRDVVYAHIWAFENPGKANGNRYILNAGQGMQQAQADIIRKHFPELRESVVEGRPGVGYNADYSYMEGGVDGRKAEREMGFRYRDYKETIRDTARALLPLLEAV